MSSIDQIINTKASICGKDRDLLPSRTWGKQLGEHQRGTAAPKVYLWSVCWENETGKGQEKQAAASGRDKVTPATSRGAVAVPALCPLALTHSRVFPLGESTGWQAS